MNQEPRDGSMPGTELAVRDASPEPVDLSAVRRRIEALQEARLRREEETLRQEEEAAHRQAAEEVARRDIARDAARARAAAALDEDFGQDARHDLHAELDEATRVLFNLHGVGKWYYADRRMLTRLSLANCHLVVRTIDSRPDDYRESGINTLITASYCNILRSYCGNVIVAGEEVCWTALSLWKVYVECFTRRGYIWGSAIAKSLKQVSYQPAAVDALFPVFNRNVPSLTKETLKDRVATICALALETQRKSKTKMRAAYLTASETPHDAA
jgi:hypothetical protein